MSIGYPYTVVRCVADKWKWETAHLTPGAGIVILRKFNDEWNVLGMWANGGYDIPKGHVEDGEGFLETAIRETFEESNIDDINFQFGYSYITLDYLRVYVAVTTQQAKIKPNHKGFMEHEHFSWLTFEVMMEKTYDYLKPAIQWAKEEATNENTD